MVEKRRYMIGTHHPDGVFIGYGPGIEAGKVLGRRRITDVASTLLYSLGVAVPADLEGVVPPAMFTAEYQSAHPITIGAATESGKRVAAADTIDEQGKAKLMEQLRMLGYVE